MTFGDVKSIRKLHVTDKSYKNIRDVNEKPSMLIGMGMMA